MLQLSRQQAYERFTAMPEVLQEALLSDTTVAVVAHAAGLVHIPENKVPLMNITVGDVIMGFLHFEDAPRTIAEDLRIPLPLAEEAWQEIEKRLFPPLRSEIEKLYAPPSPEKGNAPLRIFTEIRVPEKKELGGAALSLDPAESETMRMKSPPLPPSPLRSPHAPTPPPTYEKVSMGTPAGINISAPVSLAPQEKTVPKPPLATPMMLHEETRAKTVKQPPPFNLTVADQKLKDIKIDNPEPLRPARIEFAGSAQKPPAQATDRQEPHIVNYSAEPLKEMKKSAPPVPPAPREVKIEKPELTPAPKPIIPPKPPAPPTLPPQMPRTPMPPSLTTPIEKTPHSGNGNMIDLAAIGRGEGTNGTVIISEVEKSKDAPPSSKPAIERKTPPPSAGAAPLPKPTPPAPPPPRAPSPTPNSPVIDLKNLREIPRPPQ